MQKAGLEIGEGGSRVILQQEPDGIERVRANVARSLGKHFRQLLLGELLLVDFVGQAQRIVEPAGGEAETGFPSMNNVLLHVRGFVHPNRAVCRSGNEGFNGVK